MSRLGPLEGEPGFVVTVRLREPWERSVQCRLWDAELARLWVSWLRSFKVEGANVVSVIGLPEGEA